MNKAQLVAYAAPILLVMVGGLMAWATKVRLSKRQRTIHRELYSGLKSDDYPHVTLSQLGIINEAVARAQMSGKVDLKLTTQELVEILKRNWTSKKERQASKPTDKAAL